MLLVIEKTCVQKYEMRLPFMSMAILATICCWDGLVKINYTDYTHTKEAKICAGDAFQRLHS
jgi:hypothetical protein